MKKYSHVYLFFTSLMLLFSCSGNDEKTDSLNIEKAYCDEPPGEVLMCTDVPVKDAEGKRLKAVAFNNLRWETGETIKIKFLNGNESMHEKVKYYSGIWLNYANLKFSFVGIDEYSDVKIAFKWDCDYTTWSRIGTDCRRAGQYSPSINFGWLDDNTTERETRRVILHEFGHALGLLHEHQHPEAGIQWDKPFVYAYYEKNGWSKKMVDNNIFDKYDSSQTNYSEFDKGSIMLYAIHRDFTLNGFSVPWNYELSETDKAFIATMYPY